MKTIKGNLIDLALKGEFDVIGHGCNCFNTQGAGLAKQMAKTFGTDNFFMESLSRGDYNKLGQIDFEIRYLEKREFGGQWVKYIDEQEFMTDISIEVVNCYTQYKYSRVQKCVDYVALYLCMQKINHIFKGKKVGLPLIGGGLAGGNREKIVKIMKDNSKDINLTLVEL